MTTKKKILISCIAGVLVVALGVVGVLAANAQNVTLTTTVGFQATSVVADVEVKASRANAETAARVKANLTTTESDGTANDGKISFASGEDTTGKTIAIENNTFDKNDVLTYTIYVINKSAAKGISATVPVTTTNTVSNLSISYAYKLGNAKDAGTTATPAAGIIAIGNTTTETDVLTIVITVSVTDKAFDVANSNLDFSVDLEAV